MFKVSSIGRHGQQANHADIKVEVAPKTSFDFLQARMLPPAPSSAQRRRKIQRQPRIWLCQSAGVAP